MKSWAALGTHTHYSLLRSTAKPKALAKVCAERGITSMAMVDYGNVGCAVDFLTAMTDEGIKPILGCTFSLCRDTPSIQTNLNDKPYAHTIVLAKNMAGWRSLVGAVSRSYSKEYQFHGPRLQVEDFRDFAASGDLIAISGFMGSDIANALFPCPKETYLAASLDVASAAVRADWHHRVTTIIEQYISVFGRDNFFLATQIADPQLLPATNGLAIAMRKVGQLMGIPRVALNNTHYIDKEPHARDQRVLLAASMQTTFDGITRGRGKKEPDNIIETFFGRGDDCNLPSLQDMYRHHLPDEIEQSVRIADMCDGYTILRQPQLPTFPCPDGMSPETYLRELCEQGWRDKVEGCDIAQPIQVYRDRLEMELGVINGAGLPSYFLIVQDFMRYGRDRAWLLGPGRGSGAGCIISWLTGITGIDPIRYGLIFERFYNAGRNAPGRVSLPDIDSDVPKYKREAIYVYLQRKYGADRVAKIATFATLQGRGALTEVFRARQVDFDLAKRITKILPDKARIAEELEEMRLSGEEPSIISYALDVYRDDLLEWVQEEPDGSLTGLYAPWFEQARRLEGTKTHIGTHAAGILIGAEPLAGICPLKWDETAKASIACMEYPALESMGLTKFDILAVVFLDKAQGVRTQVRTGRIYDDTIINPEGT